MSVNVCVVTGATSGIGEAITKSLASAGRVVVAIGRRSNALRELEAANTNIVGYELDVCDETRVLELAGYLTKRAFRVEALVHCAGTYATAPFQTTASETLDEMYQVNVRGPFVLTQTLLDSLRATRGCIVFLNSSAGLTARALGSAYAATKFALRALADSIREEVNDSGIRVLSIFPGRTATPGMARQFALESRAYRPDLLIQPEDIAAVVSHALNTSHNTELTDIIMRPAVKSY
jgi:NADP-dependent 3-hydroxy acid dehydrogenase YdfG